MYAPYILFGYAVALALTLVGFVVIRRSAPELRGTLPLMLFLALDLAAVLVIGGRHWIPAVVSATVGNLLLAMGALFFYRATAAVLGVPARLTGWLAAVAAAAVPVWIVSTNYHPSPRLRLMAHAVAVGLGFACSAALLFRHNDPALRSSARPCAWITTAMAALLGAWAVYPWLTGIQANFSHTDGPDAVFSYLSMIFALSSVAALLWLSLSTHRLDLRRMAQTDSLTGLLNRGAFEEILRRELQRATRAGTTVGLMLIDLDYFKQVNDSFGHQVGDDVLRRISTALTAGTRPSDVLARYGGEEFVILLRDSGTEESRAAAERIRQNIEALTDLPESLSLTVSIGVAVSVSAEREEDFLVRADQAMYQSKREGRNQVSVCRQTRRGNVVSM